jgi:hypothetical protein
MMTMIGRTIAMVRDALRSWFSTQPYSVEMPFGREWYPSGGRTELLAGGGERRVYNTHDIVELDADGEVCAYITHDGLQWRRER